MQLGDIVTLSLLVFLAFCVEKSINSSSKKAVKDFESPWKLR